MSESNFSYTQSAWSLNDLYPAADSPELEAAFTRISEKASAVEALRPQLNPAINSQDFMNIVKLLEDLSQEISMISGFTHLLFSQNTQNQTAQTLMGRVEQFSAEIRNRILFFSLWWKSLDDTSAERLMAYAEDYRYYLVAIRNFKKFTLTEPEEKIINIKDVTGASALILLYDSLTNRYAFKLEVDGVMKELTRGELMVYVRGDNPDLRARAYQELYRVYGNDAPILGQIYQSLVRDWGNENVSLRGFKSPISVRNLANDIPDEIIDTLLDVSQKNAGVFQRFFRLKARWLGVDKLRRYDLYAPPAKSADKKYDFPAAANMVFDSLKGFEPHLVELVQRVFDENHIDSEVRKGKRGGAFCASISPNFTPWVLTNFQGKVNDIATLAHELGHAIHAMLSSEHSLFTYHPCLPLAETASTFGEMMLIDRLLKEESDETVRRDILFRQVDDNYATIMRQIFFALFERTAHDMVNQNASVDEMADAYIENLKLQFGDSLEIGYEFRWEWISVPHFYSTPFYVYAYAFGQLLVLSLYQQYKQDGEAFKPRYLQILSAGGSEAPVPLLAKAGIDISQASFWQGGFDAISELIDQLEALPVIK
jgi:oligoendopeptidase F